MGIGIQKSIQIEIFIYWFRFCISHGYIIRPVQHAGEHL